METIISTNDLSQAQIMNIQNQLDDVMTQAVKTVMTGVSPELEEKLMNSVIDMNAEYPTNQFVFSLEGVPFISIGDIHTVGAKQKGGKTSLVTIFISALIAGQWNRVRCLSEGATVLYVDTEMKKVDTQQLGKRAAAMAGTETLAENIHLVNFRPLTPAEMEVGILYFIKMYKPQIVIIDGIVDLCANFNDVEASQNLVLNFLMKTAEEYECAIINVLHTNKTDGYTELRGHLGAFFEQKGSTVIKCEKDDATNIVTVKFPTHRYAPLPEFHFTYDEQGMPICADSQYEQIEAEKRRTKEEQKDANKEAVYQERVKVITDILSQHGGCLERKLLVQEAMKQIKKGRSTVNGIVKRMKTAELINEVNSVISLCKN